MWISNAEMLSRRLDLNWATDKSKNLFLNASIIPLLATSKYEPALSAMAVAPRPRESPETSLFLLTWCSSTTVMDNSEHSFNNVVIIGVMALLEFSSSEWILEKVSKATSPITLVVIISFNHSTATESLILKLVSGIKNESFSGEQIFLVLTIQSSVVISRSRIRHL